MDLPAMHGVLARAEHCKVKPELVAAVKERCDTLEQQLPMRRALQNCAVLEDLSEVSKVIDDMKSKGLDKADKWLLPDGPKLFERAVARAEHLKEYDVVIKRVEKAAVVYDAKELMASFSIANELGVPQSTYPEAHELFLNLQDGEFIEKKQAELKAGEKNDDERIALINLDAQMEVLGLKTDSTTMKDVAQELASTHTGRKSVFRGASKMDLMGQKLYMDLSNFSKLRDPMSWGQSGLAEKADEEETTTEQSMLQHSCEYILMSLTELPTDALSQAAVKNFKNLMRCMGDKPGAFSGDKAEPIVKTAKKEEGLRDEIYVQIMKQLTDNPSAKSAENGWELFQKVIREVLPSQECCEFVRGFLEKATSPEEETEKRERSKSRGSKVNVLEITEARNKERSASRVEFMKNSLPLLAGATLKIFQSEMEEKMGGK
jgi:hypothetical protein